MVVQAAETDRFLGETCMGGDLGADEWAVPPIFGEVVLYMYGSVRRYEKKKTEIFCVKVDVFVKKKSGLYVIYYV